MKILSSSINTILFASMIFAGAFHVNELRAQQFIQNISSESVHCLVQNVFFEARNQSYQGQKAVAWVTLNRVKHNHYPDDICSVVWQSKQFSWTHDGLPDEPSSNVVEQQAWKSAKDAVQTVLLEIFNGGFDPTNGAIMYHANYVSPHWAGSYNKSAVIETHVFYN